MADLVKRRGLAAGLDGDFAGHSLRAGFATEGYAKGIPGLTIMPRPLAIGLRYSRGGCQARESAPLPY